MLPTPQPAAAITIDDSHVPYAQTILGLPLADLAIIRRAIEIMFHTAHSPAYAARVDPGAGDVARHHTGAFGVFMGYDFHLTQDGPRLIEVNTNAGGALLNGLHTAALCNPTKLAWLCCDPPSVAQVEALIVATFRAEYAAARDARVPLRTIAIADQDPEAQFLHPEFELFVSVFARHGIEAHICDTSQLVRSATGGVELDGLDIDLVYLRDTDFQLASERTRALRLAHLSDAVVVTPCPREHHLLGDKARLEIFSSVEELEALGVPSDDARFLAEVVPETRSLSALDFDEAWATRKQWVFKPQAAFASKAVYRGDKISKRRFTQIHADPHFLAQRRVAPGTTLVETPEGKREMKFDVRAYAYRDEIFLLGARVYEGQVTNMRSPGGGFSAICVARERDVRGEPGG